MVKHYHNFSFFYSLSFRLVVRLPCRSVVVLFLRSHARRIFVAWSLRYAPLWEFGLASPTLHYHRGRRSSARPPRQPVCTVYTRLQFPGWPTQRRYQAANERCLTTQQRLLGTKEQRHQLSTI